MHAEWPLIIFTLFVCLSAGIFSMQGVLALLGKAERVQMPALIASAVSLVIGGIGSFLHLEHWERIFNGFGHLTSGITQEFIAIAVFFVILVIYFIMIRRSEDGNPPKWCGIVAVIVSIALVFVMGHSYNMAARPVWDTVLLPIYYITNAAFFGALCMMVLVEVAKVPDTSRSLMGLVALVAGVIQAVATIAYAAIISGSDASYSDVGYYFDPTMPTKALMEAGQSLNIFAGSEAVLFWVGAVVVGLLVPLVLAFLVKRAKPEKSMVALSAIALVCALVGAVCWRLILYVVAFSVFLFY